MKKTNTLAPYLSVIVGLAAFLTGPSAHAQDIVWGSAQTITGDSNLIDASNANVTTFDALMPNTAPMLGQPPAAVTPPLVADGVTFNIASGSSTTLGDANITLTATSGSFSNYGNNNGGYPTSASASQAFANVMSAGGVFGSDGTITLSNLTAGLTYEVQIFDFSNYGGNSSTTFSSQNSVTLVDDDGTGNNPATYLGQFITGTFLAIGSTESINFSSSTLDVVGAINVAQINPAAAPEPSTYAMLVGGLFALLFLQARRRRLAS